MAAIQTYTERTKSMNKIGRGKSIIEAQKWWNELANLGAWLMIIGAIIVLVVSLYAGSR